MSDIHSHSKPQDSPGSADNARSAPAEPLARKSLNSVQRRILGVLIEKARTTPDLYPLSLNALISGCNQKSNRAPLMSLTPEEVEDELIEMRNQGIVAEVHGGGRVAKYRHYGYDYLGVKGVEAAVLTELLLRGEQTIGDLRSRASRFEPIADLSVLQEILQSLSSRNLVVALTPPGRGQMFTHNLYEPHELEQIKARVASGDHFVAPQRTGIAAAQVSTDDLETLKQEIAELRATVDQLVERVTLLES